MFALASGVRTMESEKITPHCKSLRSTRTRKIKKPTIGEVEKAARLAGMSYGKYQAMLYLQGVSR